MPTLLSDQNVSHLAPPRQIGAVRLNVLQAGVVIECIDLPDGKCTIGSSPSCQIRITTGELKPLQCLIVRNLDEMTVTRWAAGVLLNGAEFMTAPFRWGDCLTMGDVELQLVGAEQTVDETPLPRDCPADLIDRIEAQVAPEVSATIQADEELVPAAILVAAVALEPESPTSADADLVRLQAANQQARQRLRRLIGTLRELRDEAHGLDHHVHVLSEQLQTAQDVQAQFAAELRQSQAIAAERESQFGEELDRAIGELSASYERANAAEQGLQAAHSDFQQLHEQIETFSADCERLQQAQATSVVEKERLEQAQADRETRLVYLQQEFAHLQQAFAISHDELQAHVESLQNQLAEATAEREWQVAELRQELQFAQEAARTELQQQSATLQNELSTALAEREWQVAQLQDQLQQELHHAQDSAHAELRVQSEAFENQVAELAAERERQSAQFQQELHCAQEAAREAILRLETSDPALLELTAELTGVRQERQDLAHENQRLGEQLCDSEKRTQLLEIDVCSITAEWQRAQNTATRLQEAYVVAEAHINDLTAKMADLECAAAVEWSSECDHVSAQLTEIRVQLAAQQQALQEITAERDQHAAQLATLRQELAQRQQELADAYRQLTDLQAQLTCTEKERTQLAAELTARDSQTAELGRELQRLEGQSVRELEQRDARITELVNEIRQAQDQAALSNGDRDSRIADLTSELQQTQQQALAEIDKQQARINELVGELGQVRQQFATELQTRDLGNREESHAVQLAEELQQTREKMSAEVCSRELHITELAQELKQTQNHLSECAAQGERLHELYRQAQADLATLNPKIMAQANPACEALLSNDLPPNSPSDDPRDDDEPRIVRALASAVAEPLASDTSDPAEEFKPTSFIDQYSHLLVAESGESQAVTTHVAPQAASNLDNIDLHDETALEAYMANMMRRVRGETSSETTAPPLARSPEPDNGAVYTNPVSRMTTLTERVSAVPAVEPALAKEAGLINMQELKGTSQKPPLPTSLSAMRELANISARQAIAKHRKRRHFEGAFSKLLVSLIAGVTATSMLITAENYTSPYFLAGCGVAVVSGFWGFKLLGIVLEMIREGINKECTPAELTDLADALPIDGSAEAASVGQ